MDKLFWVDPTRNIKKTYRELLDDLNGKNRIRKYIYFDNPYYIILELIHSLVLGCEVELLDHDMSKTEIENLGLVYEETFVEYEVEETNIKDINELFGIIESNREKWSLSLYTSGTTGRPKKVTHLLTTLTRSVLYGERFQDDVWAFAYNPTHFAGLQVFFQSFLNSNTMIYIFDLDRNLVERAFENYNITNISATPTFYRNTIYYFKNRNIFVKRITIGGEKFDNIITSSLMKTFPNAKIKNVYASTECGSLFASNGETFKISNKYKTKVKISESGELLIHESLLGKASELIVEDNWYKTGDIVELIEEDEFIFVSRETEMINVGGYKVNPHEIEEEIMKINGIKDVLIQPRKNRITGNILEAEIVLYEDINPLDMELCIQNQLKETMQNWKIPRIYKFVNEIRKTRTGKKVRK